MDEFQWFKKNRKVHRNSDLLEIVPQPAKHSDLFPE